MDNGNTDKELLIKFEGKLDMFNMKVEMLATAIDNFSHTLENIENKRIATLEKRVDELAGWRQRMAGAWVVILFLGGLITLGLIGIFKQF